MEVLHWVNVICGYFGFLWVGAYVGGIPLDCWFLVDEYYLMRLSGSTWSAIVLEWCSWLCHVGRCCPVLCVPDVQMFPDVFLFVQMFLHCTSFYICYWLWCLCVADVIIFEFCLDYVYIMFSLWPEFCASTMWPPIYWWHCLWHCMCNFLCVTPFYA